MYYSILPLALCIHLCSYVLLIICTQLNNYLETPLSKTTSYFLHTYKACSVGDAVFMIWKLKPDDTGHYREKNSLQYVEFGENDVLRLTECLHEEDKKLPVPSCRPFSHFESLAAIVVSPTLAARFRRRLTFGQICLTR